MIQLITLHHWPKNHVNLCMGKGLNRKCLFSYRSKNASSSSLIRLAYLTNLTWWKIFVGRRVSFQRVSRTQPQFLHYMIQLECYGLGAVLLQRQPDGIMKPVSYHSEQRYAQIEKEALAFTWVCERFSDYLFSQGTGSQK